MANKPLKSIKFPGLNDTYTIPQVDSTLAVSGAAADAKKTGDAIGDLKSDVKELDGKIYPEWREDYIYFATGYYESSKWMCSEKISAGTYTIKVPTGYRYQIFKYVSDFEGTSVQNATTTNDTYTIDDQFIVSVGTSSGENMTNSDRNTIRSQFIITDNSIGINDIKNDITNINSEITALNNDITNINSEITALNNGNLRFCVEETSTAKSIFLYLTGSSAISDGLKVNRIKAKIIHPSGATSSETKGVGALLSVKYNGITNADNVLSNDNIFPQNHTAAHKMMLMFDVYVMPHKLLGRIDYYCDDVYSKGYDVNITTENEIECIYGIGGYFNTDTTTSKAYEKSGVLYQTGGVVAQ